MTNSNEFIVKCPACGKEMKNVLVSEQGVWLDVCIDGCGGIYFDNGEFKSVDEQHENIDTLIKLFENKQFSKVDESQTRTCPTCGSNMVKNFSSAKAEIQLDECYQCGGKFLDYSELEKVRAEYVTEEARAIDVLRDLYALAGHEISEHKAAFSKMRMKPSMLTRMLEISNYTRDSQYITEEEILDKLNKEK